MTVTEPAVQKLSLIGRTRAEALSKDDALVGHDLLELLTQAMYVDPLTIYREYIQNATDAIEEARTQGLFGPHEEGRVDVHIDLSERSIRIRDNGASVPRGLFVQRLLAIGLSDKRGRGLRGFRGIGRLAGLGYCQELVFRGRTEAREPVTEISWSARKLKELLNSDWPLHDLQSAVTEIVTVNRSSGGSWPARFFEVELRKVLRIKNDVLLNPDAVHEYLSQVAPVQFRQDFDYGARIEEFLQKHGEGEFIELVINGNIPVQRPHQSTFAPTPKLSDNFSEIEFFEIPGLDGLDAIGWMLHHGYLGALQKKLNLGGLRLRMGNIQIGENDIVAELFGEPRFNNWCVGEFHVLNKKILPNGRRDNFEHSVHYVNFQSHVAKIATELSRTCRARSASRNLLKATKHNLQKIENDLVVVRSIPHNFPFRQKHLATLSKLVSEQQVNIEKKLPHTTQRDELLKRTSKLRRDVDRISSEKTSGSLLKRVAPVKKRAYAEILSAIYEITGDATVAHEYVNKILRQLRRN
jgi:hypothetical protein